MQLAELYRETMGMFRPPKRVTVSEWADDNRVLVSESSAEPGPWRTARAPYQREIMDAFTEPTVWKIVIMACAQVGKTELALNMMGRAIDIDPGPMLFIDPTDDFAKDFSKRRVAPMIKACRVLNRKVYEAKSRDSGNTINMKTFPGGSVTFVGANSPTELAGRPVRYEFMDEIDKFPASAGTEGDPVTLAERRTDTFRRNRKVVMTSTPTIKGASKIETEYEKGTMEEWHVQCPHCGEWSFIRFLDIKFEHEKIEKTEGKTNYRVWNVRWKCPQCKEETGEIECKRLPAKWVSTSPDAIENGIRSFRLSAFMSPWSDWKDIVSEFLHAKESPELLKAFTTNVLGETWETRDRSGVPEMLYDRREYYNAEVPSGVLVLTMGIDTQDNRLEFEVVGWDRNEQSWGISKGVIPGRADSPDVWAEVDALLDREWETAGGVRMRILATFVDSGGHFTSEVYRECAKRRSRRIFAIKGEGGDGKPYVRMMKRALKEADGSLTFILGVDAGKESILYASALKEPGPGYMHFPRDNRCGYDMEYFRGLISERQVIHRKMGQSVITWEKVYERNEPLDIRNYARAAYKYFRWDFDRFEKILNGEDEDERSVRTRASIEQRRNRAIVSRGINI